MLFTDKKSYSMTMLGKVQNSNPNQFSHTQLNFEHQNTKMLGQIDY